MGTPGDRGEGQEQGGWQSEWQKQGGWQSQWQPPGQEGGWQAEQQPPPQATAPGGWTQTPDGRWVQTGPTSSGKATAALVLGIVGLVFCPLVCSVLALVFGYQARKEIDGSGGRIGGRGSAIAGIVLGWVGLVIWGLLVLLGVIGAIVDDGTSSGGGEPAGVPA
jgi:Domain of unknown function (DUF4190)